MGIFKRKEKRSAEGMVEVGDNLLTALIGGSSEVTKAEALQIPTVSACVNLIADRISALPIKLYRENGKEVEEIIEDKRLNMLNHDTGDTINATEMKKLWIRDYFLGKGSYTYIERNLFNEPTGLLYVDETRLAVAPGVDPIHKTYSIQVNGRVYFPYQFLKILRNSKGFGTGTSIISEDPLALAIYYNTMKFENATIRKGGNKKGYIIAKNKLTQDAMDKVKEAWRKLYSNSYDTKDNAVVLNDGLDFKESSSTSVELQLNENKRTNADEICKLFCMPADVLNGKADEHMISQFVQNCLMPLINTIESALDTDLLTEAEKAGHYYFAFDTSELTRGDFASRMNAYAVAYQNNFYQLDEIRAMEDLPPLDFNFIKLGLDAVLVDPKTREIYTPNTGKLEKMNAEHLTDEQLRAILEERYNENHDPATGRFTSGRNAIGAMLKSGEPIALYHHDPEFGGGGGSSSNSSNSKTTVPSTLAHFDEAQAEYLEKIKDTDIMKPDNRENVESALKGLIDNNDFCLRLNEDTLEIIANSDDKRFKTQIELNDGSTGGYFDPKGRKEASSKLFGNQESEMKAADYEKYGFLAGKDKKAVFDDLGTENYGNLIVEFDKSKISERTTFTCDDSLAGLDLGGVFASKVNSPSACSVSLDYQQEIISAASMFNKGSVTTPEDFCLESGSQYIELQFHGELNLSHVSKVYYQNSINEGLKNNLEKMGIEVVKV